MRISGAIFDVDGTLLDSMGAWLSAGTRYMRRMGIEPPAGLDDDLLRLNLWDAANFVRKLGIPATTEEILVGINGEMDDFYRNRVLPRRGAEAFLSHLRETGVRVAVATASDRGQVEAGLVRAGLAPYLEAIFTCGDLNTSKAETVIFDAVRAYLGTPREETWVFEDARHAAETAKAAGYRVCGLHDPTEPDQTGLQRVCDLYVEDFAEAYPLFFDD